MEEMEREHKAREAEEKEKAIRTKKIKEEFKDTTGEWEKDGTAINNMIKQDNKALNKNSKQLEGDGVKKQADKDGKVVREPGKPRPQAKKIEKAPAGKNAGAR